MYEFARDYEALLLHKKEAADIGFRESREHKVETIEAMLDVLEQPTDVGETSFRGTRLNQFAAIIDLLERYPNSCLPMRRVFRLADATINWTCGFDPKTQQCERDLKPSKDFAAGFESCRRNPSIRYVFGIISLRNRVGSPSTVSHLNSYLIDLKDKDPITGKEQISVEIFEPFGLTKQDKDWFNLMGNFWYDYWEYLKAIEDFFTENIGAVKIYNTSDFCPSSSFQWVQNLELKEKRENTMFCVAWSLWWLEVRLANAASGKSRSQLANEAFEYLKNSPRSLTTFIRNYAETIVQRRNRLLERIYNQMDTEEAGKVQKTLQEFDAAVTLFNKQGVVKSNTFDEYWHYYVKPVLARVRGTGTAAAAEFDEEMNRAQLFLEGLIAKELDTGVLKRLHWKKSEPKSQTV